MTSLPAGLRHWRAIHPDLHADVSSYALVEEGVLLNPLLPDGDASVLEGVTVRAVVLNNRLHVRDVERLGAPDGVSVHAPTPGIEDLAELAVDVEGYADGDELPGGLRAIEVGGLSPDEFALHLPQYRALAVADGVMRKGEGELEAMPDSLLGDDPDAVRAALAQAFGRLAEELDFDHLLLAHGDPVIGDGREQLRAYAAGLTG